MTIPEQMATEVMFASDRTCCVCRLDKHNCQIHHIDENRENNVPDNLAVLCASCHIEAHTKAPFVRNLTPDLIRLYNSSWREIVSHRLSPATANSKPAELAAQSGELAAEAFLEASLDCHRWKTHFMSISEQDLPAGREGAFADVWDVFAELWVPEYTEDKYQKFLPLFDASLLVVQQRFDRLIQLFTDVLPLDFRVILVRANRQLNTERTVYLLFKEILGEEVEHEVLKQFFYQRFVGVIRVLREVSRDADARRQLAANPDQES